MTNPEQIPLFPTPGPTPAPASVRWVEDAIKKSDTKRDGGKGDGYNPDQFIESGTKEKA